jgi:hypothetical protein
MKPPNILLLNELLKPIHDVLPVIEDSIKEIESRSSTIVDKSIFSYVASLFEIIQNEILTTYFKSFPEKIKKKEFKVAKDSLFGDITRLREDEIERFIIALSYQNLSDFMRDFFDCLSIPSLDQEQIDLLIEIKETRNLLLHNNLKINNVYLFKAGSKTRKPNYGDSLPLDRQYILDSIDTIKGAIIYIENNLEDKYAKYDKAYALKSIWNHIFNSPVLNFDDYWDYDGTFFTFKKTVRQVKNLIRYSFSGTETTLLFIWLNHFNSILCDKCFDPRLVNTYHLGQNGRYKYLYLTNIIIEKPDVFKT